MGSYPALQIQQPTSPLDSYLKAQAIRAGWLGQQVSMQELANAKLTGQKLQMEVQGQQNIIAAQHDPEWDASNLSKTQQLFNKYGVPQSARDAFYKSTKDYNDLLRQASTDHQKIVQDWHNKLDDLLQAARNAKPGTEQEVYDRAKQEALQYVQGLPPEYRQMGAQEIQNAPAEYNPDWLDTEHALLRTSQDLNEAALKKAQTLEATQKGNQAGAETAKTLGSNDALAYFASKGDKQAQALLEARRKQEVQQAGAKAGAEAAAKFPYELQLKREEQAQNPIFAVNPKTGQRELTTEGDAKAQGYTNRVKVSQSDIEKETQLTSQVNDMQLNLSRYKVSLNAMGNLSESDRLAMTHILSDPQVNNFLLSGAGFPAVISMAEQAGKGRDWNALSPDKQDALIGYLRMKNTGLLAQKVLTGMGRASKEALDIELANMPSPIEGATVGNKKLDAWQQNIDQMASRAVRLPWMEGPQDIRSRIESQTAQQSSQQKQSGEYPPGAARGPMSTGGGAVREGQTVYLKGKARRVTKVYPDGSFDAQ